jgi:hypothetical protein
MKMLKDERDKLTALCSAAMLMAAPAATVLINHHTPEATPDPQLLFQGIESARLQIPPSRLALRSHYRMFPGESERAYTVEFDGDNRRFARTDSSDIRTAFNGNEVIHFDGESVTIRHIGMTTADLLFDPRLLGITFTYLWRNSLAGQLGYHEARSVETVGRELVAGVLTWRLRAVDRRGHQRDFWVEPEQGFRVHRSELATVAGTRYVTLSQYDADTYQWLPARVETRRYGADGTLMGKRVISILSAETITVFPDSTWTLAGLKPPIGAQVSDLRIKERLGHWDGTGLSEVVNPKTGREPPSGRWVLILLLTAAACIPLLLMWRSHPGTKAG